MRHVSDVAYQKEFLAMFQNRPTKTLTLIVGYDNSSNVGIGLKA